MKERGVTIRVITEITENNVEFCIRMIKDGTVDEIRHLKGVCCGIAVSENQYMAAFLNNEYINNPNNRVFGTAIYHTEREVIELYQSFFDTLWENATSIFKN